MKNTKDMNHKKILLVTNIPISRNGTFLFISNLIKSFSYSSNYRLTVIFSSCKDEELFNELKEYTSQLYFFKSKKNIFFYIFFLIKIFITNSFDVIHVFSSNSFSFLELLFAYIKGIKVRIVHTLNAKSSLKLFHFLFRPLLNLLTTDKLACSINSAVWTFGKTKSYSLIPNGIFIENYIFNTYQRKKLLLKYQISPKTIILGSIGSLTKVKNHTFLLDVMKFLISKSINCKLYIIGDGKLHLELSEKILKLNLQDYVFILENITNTHHYYSFFDIFLMPSLYEGVPLVLVEAQVSYLNIFISSNITNEVIFNNNIQTFSLNEGAYTLSKNIISLLKTKNFQKRIFLRKKFDYIRIKNIGYDISLATKKIEDIYNIF